MVVPVGPSSVVRFGPFEADLQTGELRRNGAPIHLQQKPFQVLTILLEHPGKLVTREELRQRLWEADTFVDFDNSLNTAIAKLREALGDSTRTPRFVETLPRKGYRFIDTVLSDPTSRFAQPREQAASVSESQTQFVNLGAKGNSKWRTYSVAACVLVLAALAMIVVNTNRIRKENKRIIPAKQSTSIVPRQSVAILGFQNASGQPRDAWYSTAMAEMMSTELSAGEKLHLLPGEDVARMKRELQLRDSSSLAREIAARVGNNLKIDLLVVGSYVAIGQGANRRMRVDVRLQDAHTGEIVAEVGQSGTEEHLFELVSQVAARLREHMGVPGRSPTDEPSVRASLPNSREAARLYIEGLAKLRILDAVSARDLLEQAVAIEPSYPLSHNSLASAWTILGYDQKAKNEAKRAFDLSSNLSRADRLLIEGHHDQISGDMEKAIAVYRTLYTLFPDNLDYGLLLAEAQISGAEPSDAFTTLDALRRLPSPLSEDPRIDREQARALGALGDNQSKLVVARRAGAKAKLQGAPLLGAEAGLEECHALKGLGQFDQAVNACESSQRAFLESGDQASAVKATRLLADVRLGQGKLSEALERYRQLLRTEQALGHMSGVAATLNEMAVVYESQGDLDKAQQLYRRSYGLFLELGNRGNAAVLVGNVGGILRSLGRLSESEKLFEESLDLARAGGGRYAEAGAHINLATVAFMRGKLEIAREHAEQAIALFDKTGETLNWADAVVRLGEILTAQGELVRARQKYVEALSFEEKMGAKGLAAESRLALARLDLEEGKAAEAEQSISDALIVFRDEKMREDELQAYVVLSQCLIMQGKMAKGQVAVNQAGKISERNQNPANQILFAIAAARVKAALQDSPSSALRSSEARSELLKCVSTAQHLGFRGLEYEARLALAEVEMQTRPSAAQLHLASLKRDAQAQGFALIARRAAALGAHPS
jgi:eukaryotic-like serine/threonine-protein kinase